MNICLPVNLAPYINISQKFYFKKNSQTYNLEYFLSGQTLSLFNNHDYISFWVYLFLVLYHHFVKEYK